MTAKQHSKPNRQMISISKAAGIIGCHPHTIRRPTEAINGRLEHLRGPALGFRNLTNYIARTLLEAGGLRTSIHPSIGMSPQTVGRVGLEPTI